MKVKTKRWNSINWRTIRTYVANLQKEMVVACRNDNWIEVHLIQNKLMNSFEGRAWAVRKVITNKGSKTHGPDGKTWKTSKDKFQAISEIRNLLNQKSGTYNSGPIRRVLIPKSVPGDYRPLGIPNMIDRGLQALILLCLDPIVEELSEPSFYGFRKFRSSNDAIQRIRTILDKPNAPRFIWDADISKCFDKISHEFLEKEIRSLLNPKGCEYVSKWLKAPIIYNGVMSYPREGTPQGGVLSPLLCNITLNGLENVIRDGLPSSSSVEGRKLKGKWIIRYADDFIITNSVSKERLILDDIPRVSEFLSVRSLEISEKKSQIVDLEKEGFCFLGWSIRQQKRNIKQNKPNKNSSILAIEPSKYSIKRLKKRVKKEFRSHKPIKALIKDLNPVLRGWANYYRGSYHSQEVFQSIGHYVYLCWWRWARKKHPNRNKQWIYNEYIVKTEKRSWLIGISGKNILYDITQAKQLKVSNLKKSINPYTDEEYYVNRTIIRDSDRFRKAIYKKFNFRCFECNGPLYGEEEVHLHHLIAKKDDGKYTLDNIVPVHRICHDSITHARK